MRILIAIFCFLSFLQLRADKIVVLGSEYYSAERLKPFLQYLEEEGHQVRFIHANSLKQIERVLKNQKVDFAFLNPFSNAIVEKSNRNLIRTLLVPHDINDEVLTYHSCLITNAVNEKITLEQLIGISSEFDFSFAYPSSTSGHLFPRLELNALGIDLPERYFNDVSFEGTHSKVIEKVYESQNIIGACSFEDIEILDKAGIINKEEIKVLWKSSPIPAGVIATSYNNNNHRVGFLTELIKEMPRHPMWKQIKTIWGSLKPVAFREPTDDSYGHILERVEEGLDMIYFISHYNEKLVLQQKEIELGSIALEELNYEIEKNNETLNSQRIIIDSQKSWNTLLIVVALTVSGFILILFKNHNTIKKKNDLLEEKNQEITYQKSNLELLNEEILFKNNQLEESIDHASNIQNSLFPSIESWGERINFELLNYPLSKVSGDFTWFKNINKEEDVVILADCTGHGVPGAMLSMLGIHVLETLPVGPSFELSSFLSHLVDEINSFSYANNSMLQEGMEMIAVHLIRKKESVELNYVSIGMGGVIDYLDGEPIAIDRTHDSLSFSSINKLAFKVESISIPRDKNGLIYLYSDGLSDQKTDQASKLGRKGVLNKITNLKAHSPLVAGRYWSKFIEQQVIKHDQRDDITLLIISLR